MQRVQVVTDTACDLPDELVERYGIGLVPLVVNIGGRAYRDRADITMPEVLDRMAQGERTTVSLPSPADFIACYRRALERGRKVVSVHVTGRLSGTCGAALLAREMMPESENEIEIVDSLSGTMGQGWTVLAGARAAAAGADSREVVAAVESAARRVTLFVSVCDLMYIYRLGRLGAAQAWLGTALAAKPILTCRDGVIQPVCRVRGRRRVIPRLVDLCRDVIPRGMRVRAAVLHTAAEEEAETLAAALADGYVLEELHVVPMGPVITVGIGPGAVGCALDPCCEDPREGDATGTSAPGRG